MTVSADQSSAVAHVSQVGHADPSRPISGPAAGQSGQPLTSSRAVAGRVVTPRATKVSGQAPMEPLDPLNTRSGNSRATMEGSTTPLHVDGHEDSLNTRPGRNRTASKDPTPSTAIPERVVAPRATKVSGQAPLGPLDPLNNRSGGGHVKTPVSATTVLDKTEVDVTWRALWYKTHSNVRCRPTETEFTTAMRAFQAGNLSDVDRRLAATASPPTPTPPEEKFNMLIACKSAVATFPLQVILDSLATTHQPATWTTAKSVCRDFMRVKNVGISFNCTDRDMVTRLGGLKLMICGRPFPIREYSEYSHLYWIDLTLASDTQPDDIWTYFDARGEPPVMNKSTFGKNSIQSRHITVYFATRDPPKCLMFAPNDPVRELFVHGPESPPTFVHHRITRYNKTVPPSLRTTRQQPRQGNNQASKPAKAVHNNFNTVATVEPGRRSY
ncbi:hypothetical protein H310_14623 [Aphanomyces invadans]|uniref:Uncharacterized protein n=1 Tax=Aphanomyces invadans TaxID=157072 RepID=A0A024T8Y6_9STRA|nr:hypothetical protein H310_14623 [Aphanomyces invadans]ETV90620.1 hypothetical protein H310_14623 [Aphanomyces invadans]|eukprot:XP_008880741.1 hypothetical protein H310_14623 [Aphanomyces invadans]